MAGLFRSRSKIHVPITLHVILVALSVTLMVFWIVIATQFAFWSALTTGVIAFTVILAGLTFWLVLTIKEINLNNRQANFVDSVTHELKSPIAALQLYLETLSMRDLSPEKRQEFHAVMENELHRLDRLINQLLEVGRLDAIGENEDPVDVPLEPLLRQFAETVCLQWDLPFASTFTFDVVPVTITARKIVMDLVFSNLIENAVKYGGEVPQVNVRVRPQGRSYARIGITNNGAGVAPDERKKIFQIFYRGGSELERRRKGTGLGLYIVQTLVRKMGGRIAVHDRADGESGCTFELDLPGRH